MDRRRTEAGEKWTDLICFFTSSLPAPAFFGFLSRDSSVSSEGERQGEGEGGKRKEKPSNYKYTIQGPKGKVTKVRMQRGKSSLSHKNTAAKRITLNHESISSKYYKKKAEHISPIFLKPNLDI